MPLAPENIVITRDMLSEVMIEMGEKFDSKFLPQRKLCPNLMDKKKYVLHFVNLQFYVNYGMVLHKIHRVLSFTQSPWIEPYITFNTEERKLSTDSFSKDLYKLLSNSVSTFLTRITRQLITCSSARITCQLLTFSLEFSDNYKSLTVSLIW